VRIVELGAPDKTRPALVLSRTSAIPYLNAVSVVPITRSIRGVPSELALGQAEGLKQPSAASLHTVQTVPKSRLGRWLGSVALARKPEIRRALLFALDLDE
jgi:mRNA interferase MazF